MIIERVPEAWAQFQMHVGGLSRPNSEEEYEQIISLMHHISDSYSTTSEPYAGLFDYLCAYMETLSQFLRQVLADAAFPSEDATEVALIRDSLLSQLILADVVFFHKVSQHLMGCNVRILHAVTQRSPA